MIEVFVREIFETRRKDVIRLVLTEGPRFPKLAEFYYREVIARVHGSDPRRCCAVPTSGGSSIPTRWCVSRNCSPAPGIVAIIWSGLFDRFEPLDVRAMMRAHFDVLFGDRSGRMNVRDALRCSALRCWRLPPARKPNDPGYQGWVEADLIFVSPDEVGRVETLSVREGDAVEKGAPLFTVDPDLQQADVEMAKASVTNATQAYERAQTLLKTSAGTQKTVEDAEATLAHRAGAARLGADAAGAPQDGKPGDRLGAADLLPAGRTRAGRTAGGVAAAAGQHQDPLLRAGDGAAQASRSARP